MKVFISHAHEDRDIARQFADGLKKNGIEVWFDGYSLVVGKSLSQQIDDGLRACDFGIVIISKAFFEKSWTQRELGALVARATSRKDQRNIILPVWHQVTGEDVRNFSLILADIYACSTADGIEHDIEVLINAMNESSKMHDPESTRIPLSGDTASKILDKIIYADPQNQPDGGLFPYGVEIVKTLVDSWNSIKSIELLARRDSNLRVPIGERQVFIFADSGMMKVRFVIYGNDNLLLGNIIELDTRDERDYCRAIHFFLGEMNLYEENMVIGFTRPYAGNRDLFWVSISAKDNLGSLKPLL